jgi:putative phosphoribosyl transferase
MILDEKKSVSINSCELGEKRFLDKYNALEKLISVLPIENMKDKNWIVLALSQEAIFYAQGIQEKINGEFDYLFMESIYAPNNDECEIAVMSELEEIVIHESLVKSFDIEFDSVYASAKRIYEDKILKYIYKYRKGQKLIDIENRNVLLVNLAIETGIKSSCALKSIISNKAKSVSIASVIIPDDVYKVVEYLTDDVYYAYKPKYFVDIEHYFDDMSKY